MEERECVLIKAEARQKTDKEGADTAQSLARVPSEGGILWSLP